MLFVHPSSSQSLKLHRQRKMSEQFLALLLLPMSSISVAVLLQSGKMLNKFESYWCSDAVEMNVCAAKPPTRQQIHSHSATGWVISATLSIKWWKKSHRLRSSVWSPSEYGCSCLIIYWGNKCTVKSVYAWWLTNYQWGAEIDHHPICKMKPGTAALGVLETAFLPHTGSTRGSLQPESPWPTKLTITPIIKQEGLQMVNW